jgi:CubicO group peptidase (beta-lactamase class C family)
MAVVLIRDGAVAWQRAFGVASAGTGRSVDEATVFEAQSMSKPVFAYMVVKLAEAGTLDLDTPLTTYARERILPNDPRLDRITARHVLSHTSGLQNWRSATEPLSIHFAPGERWLYSGEGYAYLQSVVTALVGHPRSEPCSQYEGDVTVCATDIDEVMRTRLLDPFGMHSSGYVWDAAWEPRVAMPHDARGQVLRKRHPTATDAARYASSGGLHATAADYATFLLEVINPKPPDAYRLRPASRATMLTPAVTVPDDPGRTSWALGWQVFPTRAGDVIAHGGDGLGFHSFAGGSVSAGSGFVVMTNGDNGWQLLRELGIRERIGRWLGLA